ncbi:MAG: DUF2784 domain-containing protein [Planctomycetota bacterium]|nr:DUF2784 domain-containing protein [Planctomycetota bacterium]
MYERLADFVAVVHGLVVVFVAGGTLLVVLGLWKRWTWIRCRAFRLPHLGLCIAIVVFEWMGEACPLTTLERALRAKAGAEGFEGGFIAHYVSRTIHLDIPPEALALPTTFFVLLVLVLYIWAGPKKPSGDA